jgi:hypothetical protein
MSTVEVRADTACRSQSSGWSIICSGYARPIPPAGSTARCVDGVQTFRKRGQRRACNPLPQVRQLLGTGACPVCNSRGTSSGSEQELSLRDRQRHRCPHPDTEPRRLYHRPFDRDDAGRSRACRIADGGHAASTRPFSPARSRQRCPLARRFAKHARLKRE